MDIDDDLKYVSHLYAPYWQKRKIIRRFPIPALNRQAGSVASQKQFVSCYLVAFSIKLIAS